MIISSGFMKLQQILSRRNFNNNVFYDLVYEWEDSLSHALSVPIVDESPLCQNKYVAFMPFISCLFTRGKKSLSFEMTANIGRSRQWGNTADIIPLVIDFYLEKKDLPHFVRCHSRNPIVLISSKEAFDFLQSQNFPLRIAHWPLSISDKYRIEYTTKFEKKYDLVLMGRQNPILQKFLEQYALSHKDFVYVYRKQRNGDFLYFTSSGTELGAINTRSEYINLMRSARCGMYATPGCDGGEDRTHGFNQVTPRFLEYIACGCHILARYPQNSDTDYFELENFCPSINTYEEFARKMDIYRKTEVNMAYYSDYLKKHYTSYRAMQLTEILKNI